MCHHMPQSSVGLPSFVEAEQALKMSPGREAHLKLSVKKTVVLWKILSCKIVNMQQIADAVGISTGSVKTMLHEHLFMTKVCARWVPRMLDQKMMGCRCEVSKENLKLMQLD